MNVSELNLKAKVLLETHFENIELEGEISKITFHSSGHWYFELKDEESVIACAIFKRYNLSLDFKPCVGDFIKLNGSLSLYSQSGRYQFIATSMQKDGYGDLEAKFLALKEKLKNEGLFDEKHKKPLPKFPKNIGIITSFTSAALQDMIKIINQKENFLSKFYIFNALTQGNTAPNSLINALKKACDFKLDVIIIARGGGSREDLFCFNDESLARAIFDTKIPIISAIGHEIDYVISDFVADLRAPTPSAAIDLLINCKDDLDQNLDFLEDKLKIIIKNKFQNWQNILDINHKILKANSIDKMINQKLHYCDILIKQLFALLNTKFIKTQASIDNLEQSFFQHKNFFQKSKNLISIKKDGKIINLKDLRENDIVTLYSQDNKKQAQILKG